MTDLERRALLGDKQAQEKCTRQGIALPCPLCGGEAWIKYTNDNHKRPYIECKFGVFQKSGKCVAQQKMWEYNTERDALEAWNCRPAPPIGRCWECVYSTGSDENGVLFCENLSVGMKRDDFCSNFKPKERKQ